MICILLHAQGQFLIYHPRFRRQEIKFPVQPSQIAPSILKALGLNPFSQDAVRIEKTPLFARPGFQPIAATGAIARGKIEHSRLAVKRT
jgi:hypothetical protein